MYVFILNGLVLQILLYLFSTWHWVQIAPVSASGLLLMPAAHRHAAVSTLCMALTFPALHPGCLQLAVAPRGAVGNFPSHLLMGLEEDFSGKPTRNGLTR